VAATTSLTKSERLEARVTPELKELIGQAASVLGVSVTDFVASALHDRASATLERHYALTLAGRDAARFAQILLDPPAPNAALRSAAQQHREHIGE
jgi:uncharacterized protein (DUF1778 family)